MNHSSAVERMSEKRVWWGSFEIAEEHAGQWRVGPSSLWIYRSVQSWQLIHEMTADGFDDAAWIDAPRPIGDTSLDLDDLPEGAVRSRYSFMQTDSTCRLTPMLADRAVVVRPDAPLYILGGEEITLFVSTPLWIRIEVGSEGRLLQEMPSFRPSDTWFGPSTREGELCYSVQTAGRLRLENLPRRLHRAITPIHVRNHSDEALFFDRIQVPVQYLSLFEGEAHFLWTQAVRLDHEGGGDTAAVRFDESGVPSEAGTTTRLRGPRVQVRSNMIVRTFGSLFHRTTSDS